MALLGRLAFRQSDAPRFEVPYAAPSLDYGSSPPLLRYPHTVYWLDIDADPVPTIHTLHTALAPNEIAGVCRVRGVLDPRGRLTAVAAVAAAGQFFVCTPDGQTLFSVLREYDQARYNTVDFAATADGQKYFFWYSPSDKAQKAAGGRLPQYITETTATGAVTRRYTLPPLSMHTDSPPSIRIGFFGLLAPPLAALPADRIFHKDIYEDTANLPVWHLFLAMSLLSVLISAALMALLSRRGGDTRRVQLFWAVAGGHGAAIEGGVLMLLALRPWPVRVPCPNCGRPRAVDRDECPHCGAGFPRPAKDGTEIFDGEIFDTELLPR